MLSDVLLVVGLLALVAGVALLSVAAAVILAGIASIFLSLAVHKPKRAG